MRYMMFIKHARDYGNTQAPPGLYEDMGKREAAPRRRSTTLTSDAPSRIAV
jgi:hypothetical protein